MELQPACSSFFLNLQRNLNPDRSLDFGEIARLCHAACFWPGRRRSGLRRGVARNRRRTEAGKMPESLISPIRNGHGESDDRFGLKLSCHEKFARLDAEDIVSCHARSGMAHGAVLDGLRTGCLDARGLVCAGVSSCGLACFQGRTGGLYAERPLQ